MPPDAPPDVVPELDAAPEVPELVAPEEDAFPASVGLLDGAVVHARSDAKSDAKITAEAAGREGRFIGSECTGRTGRISSAAATICRGTMKEISSRNRGIVTAYSHLSQPQRTQAVLRNRAGDR